MNTVFAGRRQTANDRFKREFSGWMWCGVIVAAALHFAFFQFFPDLAVRELGAEQNTVIDVMRLPEIDIPPPPDEIRGPEIPVAGPMDLDEDVTISPTTLDEATLPPPPPDQVSGQTGGTGFAVYTVAPRVKDKTRAQRIVERHYPALLEQAGVGGSVTLQAYVDTTGRVLDARLVSSSGNAQLDEAALEAVLLFEFIPALDRDKKVAVWIEQRITFEVR
ncbi:MAG: energy transducer TonB [Gemmatimonadetes bacterium]|uniref:Energy transducer TonB n=1 Tax=Candidatus Kutchimonas denitrificans TaxID=3056748 RepID=A0AAE4Z9R5_9BACT|nr:energy transducer TonB [Gemmatimonadota bacterium]NIR76385.1 energy transducer TonB [Candidatus Kutchimonas denitrificans]NIS03195.1 energy transducer TonB [Gemmatimonadota bacterium]NIT66368.1 energy transducer TonB [Gemmatimonadota bacterium]NIU54447.1 TonB family protein [Gemmatimonadota bacterium]